MHGCRSYQGVARDNVSHVSRHPLLWKRTVSARTHLSLHGPQTPCAAQPAEKDSQKCAPRRPTTATELCARPRSLPRGRHTADKNHCRSSAADARRRRDGGGRTGSAPNKGAGPHCRPHRRGEGRVGGRPRRATPASAAAVVVVRAAPAATANGHVPPTDAQPSASAADEARFPMPMWYRCRPYVVRDVVDVAVGPAVRV